MNITIIEDQNGSRIVYRAYNSDVSQKEKSKILHDSSSAYELRDQARAHGTTIADAVGRLVMKNLNELGISIKVRNGLDD
jgi:hypothetical protein